MSRLLSIIVPSYNEEETVGPFYEEVMKLDSFFEKEEIKIEIIYVDDGSRDKTLERIKQLRDRDDRIRAVSFSRNFGKEAAIYAGLEHAKGDLVVLMDVDLQDPPELLPKM